MIESGATRRFPMLYARQNWRDARTVLLLLTLGYVGIGVFQLVVQHSPGGVPWLVSTTLPLILLPLLYLYSRMSYVVFREDGVLVHYALRRARVPYTDVERARIDTLQNVFERPQFRKMRTGTVRRLYKQRAVCLRLREADGLPDALRRRLGPRAVMERELVLAVDDAEAAMGVVKARLGARRGRAVDGEPTVASRRSRRRRH